MVIIMNIGEEVVLKTEKELLKDGFIKKISGYRYDNGEFSVYITNGMLLGYKNKKIIINNKLNRESCGYYFYDILISVDGCIDRGWGWSSLFFKKKYKQLELFDLEQ